MDRSAEERRVYLEKLRPQLNGLFNAAYTIVGNAELAEYVLQNAILEAYFKQREWLERMSFREGLMHAVRTIALAELRRRESAEVDWRGFSESSSSEIIRFLASQGKNMQRAVAMKYGCGMNIRQISEVLDEPAEKLKDDLYQVTARVERMTKKDEGKRPAERVLTGEIRREFSHSGNFEAGVIFRTFEQDVLGTHRPKRMIRCVVRWILFSIGALLLAGLFWLLAILLAG